MKRLLMLSVFLLIGMMALAQTQQGLVKTIGRPNSPGTSLGGVTVRVSGNINSVVSNQQGTFSFPIKEKRFKFSRIKKKGYEIADRDFFHYDFGYSPNAPITIAMVSKEELQRERDAIEEQTRLKLSLRFQEQNAILERKLEKNLLSEEQFREQLLALHEKYDNIDTLVSFLSDSYARTDYDNIDSFRMAINRHIENGELEQAQQLIMSKGDLDERTKELEEVRQLRLKTQMREERLQQDLASDLYQLYKIAWTQNKYDSAYIYLEKRYLTDTMQVEYLSDLVFIYFPRWEFPQSEQKEREQKHLSYLMRFYNDLLNYKQEGNNHMTLARIEDKIGDFYHSMGDDGSAITYYEKMLNTLKEGKIGLEYQPLRSIGNVYFSQKKYQEALSKYQEALKYCNKKRDYEKRSIQTKIADIYYILGENDIALKEYIKAEKTYNIPKDSDLWELNKLYILQGFLANNFYKIGEYEDAATYYTKAVDNAEYYFSLTNEIKATEPIVVLLRELQVLYVLQENYKKAYSCAQKAMQYANLYMERMPSAYSRLLYAEVLCQIADAHANMGKIDNVEHELVESLRKSEFASIIFKSRYRRLSYRVYNVFATTYAKQGLYQKALNAINKAISVSPNDVVAYQRKIEILNSIGNVDDANIVRNELSTIERELLEKDNDDDILSTNPLWQYEYEVLRNN